MPQPAPTYVWRKLVTDDWLATHEWKLDELTGGEFAVIERPNRQRLLIEVASTNANLLKAQFGGRSEKLSRDWLNEMLRAKRSKPMRIGKRLIVTSDESADSADTLVIPAGAAFGTGEHATTAMSLRLLERVTRGLTSGWRMLDAGTGSGILALAGRRFGAREVIAVENNPLALSVAKRNAKANRIRGVQFIEADVADCITGTFDVIAANLYSDLLSELLPQLQPALAANGKLILSGVMRAQEGALLRALKRNKLELTEIRRRGKWVALLAQKRG
ncbi:MAG TPA: 50S ribosomal protein L11 methyltransferase [Chthoniobacterales bacterium]